MNLKKILPVNGPPVEEVNKYIEKYKNDLIVIKYGGNVFIDRDIFNNFIADISILNKISTHECTFISHPLIDLKTLTYILLFWM